MPEAGIKICLYDRCRGETGTNRAEALQWSCGKSGENLVSVSESVRRCKKNTGKTGHHRCRTCRTVLRLDACKAGYAPLVLERGEKAEDRARTVEHFWLTGELNERSNVQFGEGGAGTFSDGKLNTLVKDPVGRNRKVLELFVEAGADEEIYMSRSLIWEQMN